MNKLFLIRNFLIDRFSFIYANLIAINLYILNKLKIKIYYNHSIGFGDSFLFYISQYSNIIKKGGYVFNFGYLTDQTIKYLFDKKKVIRSFFYIPKIFPHYKILFYLRKNNNFSPTFKKKEQITKTYQFKNTDYIKNLLITKLTNQKPSFNIEKIFKKKFISISIKHYNEDKNYLIGSGPRATANLKPIIKTLLYFVSMNFQICILGLKNEKSFIELKKKFKKNSNIKFLADISEKYSFTDQLYIAKNSIGFLGSAGGVFSLYYLLQKKCVLINAPIGKELFAYPQNHKHEKKYNRFLFKKIYMNSKTKILSIKIVKSLTVDDNFKIIENSSKNIISVSKNFLLKNLT